MPLLRVGELYSPNRRSWPEGVEYNWMPDVHELRLFFRHPAAQEMQSVSHGKAEFALVVEQDILFFVFRFQGAQKGQKGLKWSDAPCSWHMLPTERRGLPPEDLDPKLGALLQIVLVDADTGILLAIRAIGLSHEFTQALFQAIREQAEKPFNQATYDLHLNNIYATYPDSKQFLPHALVRFESEQRKW